MASDKTLFHEVLFIVCALVTPLSLPGDVWAEDELYYFGEPMYLGWAQPERKFKACDGSILPIGHGSVIKPTQKRCPRPPKGPQPTQSFVLDGTVDYIDLKENEVRIKLADGGKRSFYYVPTTEDVAGMVQLDHLSVGIHVTVTGPIVGRANAITIKPQEQKPAIP